MNIETIRKKILADEYSIVTHAVIEMRKEGITISDIKHALINGEIIEDYPNRSRCLIYGVMRNNIPLHIVCEYYDFIKNPNEDIVIITAYIPEKDKWIINKIRKR